MKRCTLLFMIMLFTMLSGCTVSAQDKAMKNFISELSQFEANNNQIVSVTNTIYSGTYKKNKFSYSNRVISELQKDPFYYRVQEGNLNIIEYASKGLFFRATFRPSYNAVVIPVDYETIYRPEILNSSNQSNFNSKSIRVEQFDNKTFMLVGKLSAFFSKSVYSDFTKSMFSFSIDPFEYENALYSFQYVFGETSVAITATIAISNVNTSLEIKLDTIMRSDSFTPIIIEGNPAYYITQPKGTVLNATVGEPIVFGDYHNNSIQYRVYLEPGKYYIQTNNAPASRYLTIRVKNSDGQLMTPFKTLYSILDNQLYFSIDTAGYYDMVVDYPEEPEGYRLNIVKLAYENYGDDAISHVVNADAELTVRLEGPGDYYSIQTGFEGYGYLEIFTKGDLNAIYSNLNGYLRVTDDLDINHFLVSKTLSPIYLYQNKHLTSANSYDVTVKFSPIVHTNTDVNQMVSITTDYTTGAFYALGNYPIQSMKLDISESGLYQLEVEGGKLRGNVIGYIKSINGDILYSVKPGIPFELESGSYLFEVNMNTYTIFKIKYTKV